MIINNISYNIVFPKIHNLRRKAFEIEDSLSSYFNAVTLIPVPDEAPEEIPRISTSSHNGHTNLNISLTNAQIVTRYDDNFKKDYNKCLEYAEDRVIQVADVLKKYVDKGFLFSGITTEITFDELPDESPIKLIKNKFLNYKSGTDPYELNFKITFIHEETYYININISNERIYGGMLPIGQGIIKLTDLHEQAHILKITIDINDRYGFNTIKDYSSTIEHIKNVFKIKNSILNEKIRKMIMEGEFDL